MTKGFGGQECAPGQNTRAITIQADSKEAINIGKRAVLDKVL